MSVEEELTWLLDAMRDRWERNAELRTRFERLSADDRRAATLLSYVCETSDGCPLLTVWNDGGVRCWYAPSHAVPASAGLLDDVLDGGRPMSGAGLALSCNHIGDLMLSAADLMTDLVDATPGRPNRVVVTAVSPGVTRPS